MPLFGPRAQFYRNLLDVFSRLRVNPEAPGEVLGKGGAIRFMNPYQKQDLRFINPELFQGVGAKPTWYPPSFDPLQETPLAGLNLQTKTFEVPTDLFTRKYPPTREAFPRRYISEEAAHLAQIDREGAEQMLSKIGQKDRMASFLARSAYETDAEEFSKIVRQRAEGKITQEEIPSEYKKYILGLAGALGLGATLQPEEAEARGGVGKLMAQTPKAVEGAVSSASKMLEGRPFMDRVIKKVTQGSGDWRYIIFEDGNQIAVEKDVINKMCRDLGTKDYISKLATKTPEEQLGQAKKSLDYHLKRQFWADTKPTKVGHREELVDKLKELGMDPHESVWVESHKVFLPKEYADILDKEGLIKIKGTKSVK